MFRLHDQQTACRFSRQAVIIILIPFDGFSFSFLLRIWSVISSFISSSGRLFRLIGSAYHETVVFDLPRHPKHYGTVNVGERHRHRLIFSISIAKGCGYRTGKTNPRPWQKLVASFSQSLYCESLPDRNILKICRFSASRSCMAPV